MYALSKHTNYITDQTLLNPISDSLNINTLNSAFVLVKKSTKCAKFSAKISQKKVCKHDIIEGFCRVIKTATYHYLMSW